MVARVQQRVVMAVLLAMGMASWAGAPESGIFLKGRAVKAIVVPDNPEASAIYAAEELRRCLELSTGVSLPLVKATDPGIQKPAFVVGGCNITGNLGLDLKALPNEGFYIKTTPDYIVISGDDHPAYTPGMLRNGYFKPAAHRAGGTRTGSLFGTYTFLKDQVGADWYFPGPLGEVVPKHSKLDIPDLDIKAGPSFEQRMIWVGNDHSGTDELPMPEIKDSKFQTEHVWGMRRRQGMSWGCPAGHSMHFWGEYFGKDHPEYFALVEGKRTNDWGWTALKSDGGRDFCWASPATTERQIAEMRLFFAGETARHPFVWNYCDPSHFPIGANDGTMRFCECELCRKWYKDESAKYPDYYTYYKAANASDLFFHHVAEVAKVAQREYPGKYIVAMAYGPRFLPPEQVTLPSNVKITLAGAVPAMEAAPEYKAAIDTVVAGWRKRCEIPVLWEYGDCFRSGSPYIPLVMPHLVANEIKSRQGEVGGFFFCQGECSTGPFTQPELYVASELMWDVNQDTEKILDRFYVGLYGAAAPDVKACYSYLEGQWLEALPKIYLTIPEREHIRLTGKTLQGLVADKLWTEIFPPRKIIKALDLLRNGRKNVKKYSDEWIRLNRCEEQLLKTLGAATLASEGRR